MNKNTHQDTNTDTHTYTPSLKMPKIDTLDALEVHEENEDDCQANSN